MTRFSDSSAALAGPAVSSRISVAARYGDRPDDPRAMLSLPLFRGMLDSESGVFAVLGCSIKARIRPYYGRQRSAVFGRDIAEAGAECGNVCAVIFETAPLRRGWPCRQSDAGAPFVLRADRARRETAAAIRADIVQHILDALGAERALKAADAGVRRARRQILVAVLAIGPELQ